MRTGPPFDAVAFEAPDSSISLVALNGGDTPVNFSLVDVGSVAWVEAHSLPPHSIHTYRWMPSASRHADPRPTRVTMERPAEEEPLAAEYLAEELEASAKPATPEMRAAPTAAAPVASVASAFKEESALEADAHEIPAIDAREFPAAHALETPAAEATTGSITLPPRRPLSPPGHPSDATHAAAKPAPEAGRPMARHFDAFTRLTHTGAPHQSGPLTGAGAEDAPFAGWHMGLQWAESQWLWAGSALFLLAALAALVVMRACGGGGVSLTNLLTNLMIAARHPGKYKLAPGAAPEEGESEGMAEGEHAAEYAEWRPPAS